MMKINHNHILTLAVAVLIVLCVRTVYTPAQFEEELAVRERAVKERLVLIRKAEESYRKVNGTYADSFSKLTRSGLLADSLQFIPYSDGKRFSLSATVHTNRSGRKMPLMECGAAYADYLHGLDNGSISEMIVKATDEGRYPGLKIGDLLTPNDNAGNWE